MGWKATGQPTVRRQRDKWVVRVDGIHTETGRHRPRQLGTYPSQRSARSAASKLTAEGAEGGGKGTVGLLVNRWVAAKTDITEKSQMQNRWAAGHISKALGAIRLEQLDRADIDFDAGTVRIDEALIEVEGRPVWTEGKNERSRRTFGLDADTLARLVEHRSRQDEERLLAGNDWDDQNLLLSTRTGNRVSPGNFDQTLDRLVKRAGVPRLTSHGLRHTAATHMVRQAKDLGELRAVADILGHSPDMLMRTYAHALPDSLRAVSDRIGERVAGWDS